MSNFQLDYTGQEVNELLAKANNSLQVGYHDSTKQDVINDLSTIRSGAELGATAIQQSQLEAYHDVTKQDTITDLESYVKDTDYATDTKAGVIKVSGTYGAILSVGGYIQARVQTKEQYTSGSNAQLIGKGTYENVRLDKSVEEWQFTLADGSTVTKKVVLGA